MLTSGDVTPSYDDNSSSGGSSRKNKKSVVYWMQRDVRTVDNWALLFAGHLAETRGVPLHVFHVLPPPPPKSAASTNSKDDDHDAALHLPELAEMRMTERHGKFLLGGLQRVRDELDEKSVALHVLKPLSHRLVPSTVETKIIRELDPAVIVCDFTPIRHVREWMEGPTTLDSLSYLGVPLWQVQIEHGAQRSITFRLREAFEDYLRSANTTDNTLPATVADLEKAAGIRLVIGDQKEPEDAGFIQWRKIGRAHV